MNDDLRSRIESLFPYPEYRDYQREALFAASTALFEDGYDNVVLNLPTGIGKSGINVTLAELADDAFITTPQKALRSQLENDTDLNNLYSTLRGRADYFCPVAAQERPSGENNCKTCKVNNDSSQSCLNQDGCTYWRSKVDAMADTTAVLTFSYLIIDGFLPEKVRRTIGEGDETQEVVTQISFTDRELLVVDECHKLESQVASLHAGISVSEYSLPEDIVRDTPTEIELPEEKVATFADVEDELQNVYDRAQNYIQEVAVSVPADDPDLQDCISFCEKFEWCREQAKKGRDWVIDKEEIVVGSETSHSIKIIPVDVDEFLKDHVWNRAEKRVLSTATMPFSNSPSRWLSRLGLDPSSTKVIQYPMPFPKENRLIKTNTTIDRMSRGRFEENLDKVIEKLRLISRKHSGENGLIHTTSYSRARELYEPLSKNAMLHKGSDDRDLSQQIYEWQQSDADMFFSPAAMDGVDLPGEKCRWQALVKVPYPNLGNPRTKYLTKERGNEDLYMERTSQQIQQSVGRGVRNQEDQCTYYVLDKSFSDVREKAEFPDWFEEAIV